MNKKLQKIKEEFQNTELFEQALTHRSWINENAGLRHSNERLEFLGDAVLEFVVSSELYERLPNKEEGFLTALRANIVNTTNLSLLAKQLEIGEVLYLSKGERRGGGNANTSLLADTVEAIIGAIYIDRGFEAAQKFIFEYLLEKLDVIMKKPLKDPKSMLQEVVQAKGYATPKYTVVKETGPDHDKQFEVEVMVDSKKIASGSGKSKNEAEQDAAGKALDLYRPA